MTKFYQSAYKAIISLLLLCFFYAQTSYAQQIIGSFSQMDGGFENQTIGNLTSTSSSSTPANGIWARGGTSGGGSGSAIVSSANARSGLDYITLFNTGSSTAAPRTFLSPWVNSASIDQSTSYVIQFYCKAADGVTFPNTTLTAGVSVASGTSANFFSFTPSGTPNIFTKYSLVVTPPVGISNNGYSAFKIAGSTTNNVKFIDIDDWVVYPGTSVDNTLPLIPGVASTSNPTGGSLEISWGASADIDGGGYVVVRYSSNPTLGPEPNPNVNGIYNIGNNIGLGTVVYIGTSTSFIDYGLVNNSTYFYRIYTADKAFNYSNPSTTNGTTNTLPTTIKYYIDFISGNDAASGTIASPWKNISKINSLTFLPGTQIYLKAGCSWTGQQLKFNGSGTAGNSIVIDKYGAGAKPILAGNGLIGQGVVYLYNQSYIEINNLEVTNSPNGPVDGDYFVGLFQNGNNPLGADRRGVMVAIDNYGTSNHIYLKNLDVHHVKGQLGSGSTTVNGAIPKRTGGIYFTVLGITEQTNSNSRFNDVLVDNCSIAYCENIGISLDNEWNVYYPGGQNSVIPADVTEYNNWYARRFSNIKVSNNVIHHIGKNAMIIRCTDETGLIEYNTCYETALGTTGNTMFTARAKGTIFQFNEGSFNRSTTQNVEPGNIDGCMYDPDFGSVGIIFQYSYSHDNSEGIYWGCNTRGANNNTTGIPDPGDVGCTLRYCISQNDKGSLVFFNYSSAGNEIYNNIFYTSAGISGNIIHENSNNNHTYNYFNNIIYNLSTTQNYSFGSGTGIQTRTISNNVFFGQHPTGASTGEPSDPFKIILNPLFVNPGSGTLGLNSLNGYRLNVGSPVLANGAVISNNGGRDYFGNIVPNTPPNRGAYEGAGIGVLAVKLINFSASKKNNSVLLLWTTLFEQNSSHFEIERSTDGVNFFKINEKKNAGNSTLQNYYSSIDFSPANGINYYRLVEIDLNGKATHSNILQIIFKKESQPIVIFPNPSKDYIQILLSNHSNEPISVMIYTVEGRLMKTIKTITTDIFNLKIDDLPKGLYVVNIYNTNTNQKISTKTFLKEM